MVPGVVLQLAEAAGKAYDAYRERKRLRDQARGKSAGEAAARSSKATEAKARETHK